MGRALKYDFEDKRDICHKLYVEEHKTLKEVVEYFSQHFGVPESELPCPRVFYRYFRRWGFPGRNRKKMSAETEAAATQRMIELWQQNVGFNDTMRVMLEEGYDVGLYDFHNIRRKSQLNRRGGSKFDDPSTVVQTPRGKKRAAENDLVDDTQAANQPVPEEATQQSSALTQPAPALSEEEAARRAERLAQIQAESDQRLSTRKRRRRIRGFGHLPPDAPDMAPRYASETSLDECKAILNLDNDIYMTVREAYKQICIDMNIERKKTTLEDGRWQASKDRLVRENMHLSAMMHPLQDNLEQKAIGLDNICADVTKRMRSMQSQMMMPEANNLLGLNPLESKEVRHIFYEILEADQYTTKLACGDVHWAELREEWFAKVPALAAAISENHARKNKAIDLLARDACKRYCENQVKQDPSRRQHHRVNYGPGPGAVRNGTRSARPAVLPPPSAITNSPSGSTAAQALAALQSSVTHQQNQHNQQSTTTDNDTFIDPALQPTPAPQPTEPAQPIPAYFRLAPSSTIIGNHPRMWLNRLTAPTLAALRTAATSQAGASRVGSVQGIVTSVAGEGEGDGGNGTGGEEREDAYQIDTEDELRAYLAAVEGGKAIFVVSIEGGYA